MRVSIFVALCGTAFLCICFLDGADGKTIIKRGPTKRTITRGPVRFTSGGGGDGGDGGGGGGDGGDGGGGGGGGGDEDVKEEETPDGTKKITRRRTIRYGPTRTIRVNGNNDIANLLGDGGDNKPDKMEPEKEAPKTMPAKPSNPDDDLSDLADKYKIKQNDIKDVQDIVNDELKTFDITDKDDDVMKKIVRRVVRIVVKYITVVNGPEDLYGDDGSINRGNILTTTRTIINNLSKPVKEDLKPKKLDDNEDVVHEVIKKIIIVNDPTELFDDKGNPDKTKVDKSTQDFIDENPDVVNKKKPEKPKMEEPKKQPGKKGKPSDPEDDKKNPTKGPTKRTRITTTTITRDKKPDKNTKKPGKPVDESDLTDIIEIYQITKPNIDEIKNTIKEELKPYDIKDDKTVSKVVREVFNKAKPEKKKPVDKGKVDKKVVKDITKDVIKEVEKTVKEVVKTYFKDDDGEIVRIIVKYVIVVKKSSEIVDDKGKVNAKTVTTTAKDFIDKVKEVVKDELKNKKITKVSDDVLNKFVPVVMKKITDKNKKSPGSEPIINEKDGTFDPKVPKKATDDIIEVIETIIPDVLKKYNLENDEDIIEIIIEYLIYVYGPELLNGNGEIDSTVVITIIETFITTFIDYVKDKVRKLNILYFSDQFITSLIRLVIKSLVRSPLAIDIIFDLDAPGGLSIKGIGSIIEEIIIDIITIIKDVLSPYGISDVLEVIEVIVEYIVIIISPLDLLDDVGKIITSVVFDAASSFLNKFIACIQTIAKEKKMPEPTTGIFGKILGAVTKTVSAATGLLTSLFDGAGEVCTDTLLSNAGIIIDQIISSAKSGKKPKPTLKKEGDKSASELIAEVAGLITEQFVRVGGDFIKQSGLLLKDAGVDGIHIIEDVFDIAKGKGKKGGKGKGGIGGLVGGVVNTAVNVEKAKNKAILGTAKGILG